MEENVPDKSRSLRALDSTNFFLADVETGVGPFVASFLNSHNHWNASAIGLVLSSQNIAAVLAQSPAGWLIDDSRHKKWLVAIGAVFLSLGSLFVVHAKSVALQMLNQAVIGVALAVLLPTVSAISLGIVGKTRLSPRIGRNAMFIHIGNTVTALVAGYFAYRHGQQWIFYICAMLGVFASASALTIRSRDIDNQVARAKADDSQSAAVPISTLLRSRDYLLFVALVVVFHIANASMLPLAAQQLARKIHDASAPYMSGCIVLSQLVMIPVAFGCGQIADRIGRKPLFLIGFLALVLRGLLFTTFQSGYAIVAIEALDGVGTAIAGVTSVLVISDLAKGTGRFNFLQGTAQAALGVGASFGKLSSGWLADALGFPVTFASLAIVAAGGLIAYQLSMPETADIRPSKPVR